MVEIYSQQIYHQRLAIKSPLNNDFGDVFTLSSQIQEHKKNFFLNGSFPYPGLDPLNSEKNTKIS
jgi:hypothetical protein